MSKIINRDGETNISKFGENMKIINYKNRANFDILLEDGYIKHCTCYNNFKNGSIKNPSLVSLFGVGYLDVEYGNGVSNSVSYKTWLHMLSRCYNKKEKKYKFYGGCGVYVCDEWLSYKVFKEWFDKNYYEVLNDKMNLDKDILNKGNKIYSPNNCIFAPSKINKLFTKAKKIRGSYPIGVCYHKPNKKYTAVITKENKSIYLGCFDDSTSAFYKYKKEKENYIKEIADKYKYEIPQELYDALYRYEVEESD